MSQLLTSGTVLLFAASLSAQATFTQLTPATSPSPRAGAVAVTDGAVLYSFGGKPTSTTEANDLWVFDGTSWLDITPTTGPLPPTRDWYAATYDTGRGRFVLFGGRSTAAGGDLGDTWEFDGAQWTQLTPAVAPSARRWPQMAYDPQAGACILFGGQASGTFSNETWSWDGTAWTLLSPANAPSARGRGRMSYDPTRGEILYFGGKDTAAGAKNDTWIWSAGNWQQVVTAHAPTGGRFAYGMTYDLLRDRHVLFGGTVSGPTLGDCWEFDGFDWTQRSGGPAGRTGPTFAFVPGLGQTFLFGGFSAVQLGDTWSYQTATFPAAVTYGTGCTGPGGSLTLTPTTQAWTGEVFQTVAGNFGPTSLALEVWGYGQVAVPLAAVLPIAGVGCNLLTTLDVFVGPGLPAAGQWTSSLPIPNDPAAAGATLLQQVAELQFDLGGNWTGLFTTNGVSMTIGMR
ncbi:MAG: hypothetical protein H6835_02760 [Planctomycetes bacterium]|nr:hypothetical protein [Planctomycetota bacterium]